MSDYNDERDNPREPERPEPPVAGAGDAPTEQPSDQQTPEGERQEQGMSAQAPQEGAAPPPESLPAEAAVGQQEPDRAKKQNPVAQRLRKAWASLKARPVGVHFSEIKKSPAMAITCVAIAVLMVVAIVAGPPSSVPTAVPGGPATSSDDNKTGSLKITAAPHLNFAATGAVTLRGLEDYAPEQVEQFLSFQPPVGFTVEKESDGRMRVQMDPDQYRNTDYTGTFLAEDEDGKRIASAVFTVNDPALKVSIENGSSIYPYEQLVLTFSEQVDIDSLNANMSIEPRTAYDLDYDLNTVIITPHEGWVITNNYQIAIGADYTSRATGRQFADNQVLSFRVRDPDAERNSYVPDPALTFYSGDNYVLSTDTDMTLVFLAENLKKNVPLLVHTYRMDSLEKYRDQGYIYLDYDIKLDSLEKLDTNAFLAREGPNYFNIPNFGEGGYIISITYDDPLTGKEVEVRTSYLITPINVYIQSSAREAVVWINSTEGANLAGYTVEFVGENAPSGVTDANGLAVIEHEPEFKSSSPAFGIYDPAGNLAYYDDTGLYVENLHTERYYNYLFLDRTLYRPEDTVQFWGFVKPFRYNLKEMPETVTVRFDDGGLNLTAEVELSESGVFFGEIPLERIRSSQYRVQAELHFPAKEEGETGTMRVLDSEYVSVKEFEKPTYVLGSEVKDAWYGPHDEVEVTASASFYDGTLLPHYDLEVSYYDAGRRDWTPISGVKTDSMGNAAFSFPANTGELNLDASKGLRTNQYKVQIASDGEMITHIGYYYYFPSDILIDYEFEEQNGENVAVTIKTYELDTKSEALREHLDGLESPGDSYLSNARLLELAQGNPVDTELRLTLRWSYYDTNSVRRRNRQKSTYDYYVQFDNWYSMDFTEGVRNDIKALHDWDTQPKKISVETREGVARIEDLIYLPEDAGIDFSRLVTLRAHIDYEDTLGNKCAEGAYYPSPESYEREFGGEEEEQERIIVEGYSFAVTDSATGDDLTPGASYYRQVFMEAGKSANFRLLYDSDPLETRGRLMYTIIQDGLYESHVTSADSFNLNYPVEYGKSVRLVAAYFDGEKTEYVKQLDLYATEESLGIDVEVTPDQISYRPGDTVNLSIRATDYAGQGVAGNVAVSVVDEAIFALSEQKIDVLYSLYYDMLQINNYVYQYCTTYRDEPYLGDMFDGGKGGDGGVSFYDSYRKNFKDTAVFLPVTTDASGRATASFELPDNTTSWRITTVAIGNNLRAGQSKENIISSLPFFIQPVMTTKYIDGDDVAMLVQAHGSLLNEGSEIEYAVRLTGDDTDLTIASAGPAYQALEFNFGKLPMGSYTVVATARIDGYSDTVEVPLSVIKSNLELVIHKRVDVAEIGDISAMRYPVTLTLYDEQNEGFMTSINSLFGHYCMQANQRLSRFVAKRVIRQTVENGSIPSYISEGNDHVSDMQNSDGGIAPYPKEPSELMVSTYVLLVAKDQFNHTMLAEYFRGHLETETDDKLRAAAYLGLASIGKTDRDEILEELNRAMGKASLDVEAYYIAALAYLGETETAQGLYEDRLAFRVQNIPARGRTRDMEWDRDAAAIWIAASRLEHEDADTLSIYFGSAGWRYRTLFEAMIYVTNYGRTVTPARFSYTVKGETTQVDLGYNGMTTMVLSKSELESLSFNNTTESLKAVAYYVGEPTEFGLEQSEHMSISKAVSQVDDNTYEVALTVELDKDAPLGQYDISDWVPSNTRLYSHDKSYKIDNTTAVSFRTTQENQNLYVSFTHAKQGERTIEYRYRIRRTFQSEAVLDTVYIIHGDSGENANSERDTFAPKAAADANPVVRVGEGITPSAPAGAPNNTAEASGEDSISGASDNGVDTDPGEVE